MTHEAHRLLAAQTEKSEHPEAVVEELVDAVLERAGWTRGDVDVVVPHQAGRHGLELLTSRLGFRAEQIFLNLPERGNCIAASVPLALAEAAACGRVRRGDRVLLIGTGAGLTLGGVAITY